MTGMECDYESLGFPTREVCEFPNIVNAEVYRSQCPCRCVHCPVGTTEPDMRAERFGEQGMALGLYEKIADEMSHYPGRVLRVHSVGEPLLWGNLPKALAISHGRGVKSWIFTSAVTDDLQLLDCVCENADIVEVSANSSNSADYKATKGVDAFRLVMRNIRHMRTTIRAGLPTRLIVSRVQSTSREADEEFVRYWKSTGLTDDAFVRSYHTYNELLPELQSRPACAHEPCLVHWARFNIAVDGRAVVCFNELFKPRLDPSLVLGDTNTQSIAEVWHGPELSALRKAELTADYSGLACRCALPCKNCTSCQPLHGDRKTSENQVKHLKNE